MQIGANALPRCMVDLEPPTLAARVREWLLQGNCAATTSISTVGTETGRAADRPNPIYQSPVWRLIETSTHDWKPSFCSSQPLARRRCSAGAKKEMGLTGELAIYHNLGVNIGTSRRRRSWRTLPSPKNLCGQSASTVYQSSRRLVLDLVPGVRHDSGHILESFRNRCTAASEIPLESRGLDCPGGSLPPEPNSQLDQEFTRRLSEVAPGILCNSRQLVGGSQTATLTA